MLIFWYKNWLIGPIKEANLIIDNSDVLSFRPARRRKDLRIYSRFNSNDVTNRCVLDWVVKCKGQKIVGENSHCLRSATQTH